MCSLDLCTAEDFHNLGVWSVTRVVQADCDLGGRRTQIVVQGHNLRAGVSLAEGDAVVVVVEDLGLVRRVAGSHCDGLLSDRVEFAHQLVQRGAGVVALEPDGFTIVGIARAAEVLLLTRVDWRGVVSNLKRAWNM